MCLKSLTLNQTPSDSHVSPRYTLALRLLPSHPPQISSSTHLAAKHEGDGAVGAGHLAVAQHGREALHLLGARGHLVATGALGRQPTPPGALPAPPMPPAATAAATCRTAPTSSSSAGTSCLSTSSSTAAAAAAPCSHHPPSFLASLHRGGEEKTPRALPSSRENLPCPPPSPPPPLDEFILSSQALAATPLSISCLPSSSLSDEECSCFCASSSALWGCDRSPGREGRRGRQRLVT
ncbi:hypothetical protein XENORESO_014557 [Xenotaenia resolanae]|uniref:Uncharacterized protein n=1 Tax=Xenotaenia resolanae TaxID=208358 RepID=A0ABV0WD53_9TELE